MQYKEQSCSSSPPKINGRKRKETSNTMYRLLYTKFEVSLFAPFLFTLYLYNNVQVLD